MPIFIDPIAIIIVSISFIVLVISFLRGDSDYQFKRQQEKLKKKTKP